MSVRNPGQPFWDVII